MASLSQFRFFSSHLIFPSTYLKPSVLGSFLGSSFHTSSVADSRIKFRFTHKPYFHTKKTAKHPDTPITFANKKFLEEVVNDTYSANPLRTIREVQESEDESLLKPELQPWPRGTWDEQGVKTTRVGLIGRKIGVVPMWFKNGRPCTATMIHIEDNHVVRYISPEDFSKTIVAQRRIRPTNSDYVKSISRGCLVVGALSADPAKFTKDYCGLFTQSGVMPKKKLVRCPVSENALVQPGTQLVAAHFQVGQYIDIVGRSARRGFQGVMKRWGFSGMPALNGVTKSHRRPGCIGSGRDKGRVWPGQKMPGHVGNAVITQRGLKILRINHKHNVIYVLGQAIPGENGEFVKLFDTKTVSKRFETSPRFFPTCYPEDYSNLEEEEYSADVHKFQDPSISYDP